MWDSYGSHVAETAVKSLSYLPSEAWSDDSDFLSSVRGFLSYVSENMFSIISDNSATFVLRSLVLSLSGRRFLGVGIGGVDKKRLKSKLKKKRQRCKNRQQQHETAQQDEEEAATAYHPTIERSDNSISSSVAGGTPRDFVCSILYDAASASASASETKASSSIMQDLLYEYIYKPMNTSECIDKIRNNNKETSSAMMLTMLTIVAVNAQSSLYRQDEEGQQCLLLVDSILASTPSTTTAFLESLISIKLYTTSVVSHSGNRHNNAYNFLYKDIYTNIILPSFVSDSGDDDMGGDSDRCLELLRMYLECIRKHFVVVTPTTTTPTTPTISSKQRMNDMENIVYPLIKFVMKNESIRKTTTTTTTTTKRVMNNICLCLCECIKGNTELEELFLKSFLPGPTAGSNCKLIHTVLTSFHNKVSLQHLANTICKQLLQDAASTTTISSSEFKMLLEAITRYYTPTPIATPTATTTTTTTPGSNNSSIVAKKCIKLISAYIDLRNTTATTTTTTQDVFDSSEMFYLMKSIYNFSKSCNNNINFQNKVKNCILSNTSQAQKTKTTNAKTTWSHKLLLHCFGTVNPTNNNDSNNNPEDQETSKKQRMSSNGVSEKVKKQFLKDLFD